MPTISTFYGILIRMFFNDHPPPHFHARYGEFEATIDIGTLDVLEGQLPRRATGLTSCGKQTMDKTVKAVIPAPAWLRKAMDDSLKQRTTPEKALLQTQNLLKQRKQRSSAKPAESATGPIKRAD